MEGAEALTPLAPPSGFPPAGPAQGHSQVRASCRCAGRAAETGVETLPWPPRAEWEAAPALDLLSDDQGPAGE